MKRLSALDALFLYMETPETPMHVASLTIFKPEAPSDDLFARFRAHTAARLDLLPSYRRRLESTPLGLDHPVWVDDQPDLDYHIRHAALPKPGGMEELRALVAQLHAVPLDRTRPLWEYTFIEGLEDGAFAVYVKVHHSAMDGVAGMATIGVIYDFAPQSGEERAPRRLVSPDPEPVDGIEIASTAIGDFVRQGFRAVASLPSVARALTKTAPNFVRDAKFLYSYVKDMPRTPFNAAISGHRVFATASLPFAEIRAVARSRGATVNDVVLALTSGALRRYLSERGALPEKPLTAGVPASVRPRGDAQLNNQVIFTVSKLPTDVAEPLPRLAAAKAAGEEAKALFSDLREFVTTNVSIIGAPLAIMGIARLWAGARAANYVWPFFNLVVSNVPGPREPFYCVGAKATHYFPISIPFHGGALNLTVQSYLDTLDFGLIACSETVPDAQRIADLIVEDFAALRAADAEAARPDFVTSIAVALAAKPPATHQPIALGEAKPERAAAHERKSPLGREIDGLAQATEALRRRLESRDADVADAAAQPDRPVAKGRRSAEPAEPAPEGEAPKQRPPEAARARKAPARSRQAGLAPKS
ncbi:diacylglycerol O-acyltransferase [Roseiarcus fermentans]|uniref:diacylglycerol O-acyltransferase n=1 Tax=Roseiarcus fermentans TaxID=1473586 RepID=A0A366ETE6_9HYPH|nr:wax ester/triacylglycerol synthase family O-acyltransferase [Roseiarcus fermentans]RBP05682.1 diacylglycerol O-acyltransferase [Roseiarcus fermentans]